MAWSLALVLNELNQDSISRVDGNVDIFLVFEDLTTLLLSQNQVDTAVHHELFLQNLLDLLDFLDLVEIDGHLELLVVTAFN